jgi:RNA polymerase sigma-70 factor (ECF subfamily)
VHEPFQMHVLAVGAGGISHVVAFHMTSFEKFGLPASL